jgi:hypothetical protein
LLFLSKFNQNAPFSSRILNFCNESERRQAARAKVKGGVGGVGAAVLRRIARLLITRLARSDAARKLTLKSL